MKLPTNQGLNDKGNQNVPAEEIGLQVGAAFYRMGKSITKLERS